VLVDNRHRGLVEEVNQERDGDEACLTAKRSIEGDINRLWIVGKIDGHSRPTDLKLSD
jgi:hypothetical protein